MVVLISVILVAGVLAAFSNFSSDSSHVGQTSGVWSEEHGHYH
jgi:hypothetical protein